MGEPWSLSVVYQGNRKYSVYGEAYSDEEQALDPHGSAMVLKSSGSGF